MKNGKRLLILLLAMLTMVVAFSALAFAEPDQATDTYYDVDLGRATLTADNVTFDGKPHDAKLDDGITGNKQEGDDVYGFVSDVVYYKSDASGTTGEECGTPVNAGYYIAKSLITIYRRSGSDYVTQTETLSVKYEIRKKQITVTWVPKKLYYNGAQQVPTATAVDDDNKAVGITVVPAEGDDGIDAGDHQAVIRFTNSTFEDNCVINGAQTQEPYPYEIQPLPATIAWYRPVYDNKTGEVDEDEDLQEVTASTVGMVYNGKPQTPTAKVENLIGDDEVNIRVSIESTQAVEVGNYIATAHVVGGADASNYDFRRTVFSKDFEILPRPVVLEWGYNPGDAEDVWVDEDGEPFGNLIDTTYNGLLQEPVVRISNLPEDKTDDDAYVKDVECTYAERTSTDGSVIEDERLYIDAGHYRLKVGDLSDKKNYTYYILEQDADTGAISVSKNDKVDNLEERYRIHRYEIQEIAWSNDVLTYNAKWQLPTAEIADLQGPDTPADVQTIVSGDRNREEATPGWCNAGEHSAYVIGIKGDATLDLSRNYKLRDRSYSHEYTIQKANLVVIANPRTIVYGDAPANAGITYSGLLNGDPNHDNDGGKPGKYADPEYSENMKDVVEGTPRYSYNYSTNGRPGTYAISVSGLRSNNYNITYQVGALSVIDKASTLVAKGTKKGSRGILVSWNAVSGAATYDVYMSQCNAKGKLRTPRYVKTVAGNSVVIKKLDKKKLKKKTCYKYYVVAKNAAGNVIAQSREGHFITGNVSGKKTNAKSMAVNTTSVTVGRGGTAGLSASYKKAKNSKKYKLNNNAHSALTRFTSENPAVATVDANGIVTGVGTGWTRVYVQGVTGMWQVVEVNVQ